MNSGQRRTRPASGVCRVVLDPDGYNIEAMLNEPATRREPELCRAVASDCGCKFEAFRPPDSMREPLKSRHCDPIQAARWKDFSRKSASRPVSRVLYGLGALRRRDVAAIHLGRVLPRASCNLPGRRAGNCPEGCPSCRPYSVLLPVWFAMPPLLPGTRWALTPPFHPCRTATRRRRQAVCFLWHFPWGRPRRMLSGTVFPWSPDFPHPQPFGSRWCGRPAGWQAR